MATLRRQLYSNIGDWFTLNAPYQTAQIPYARRDDDGSTDPADREPHTPDPTPAPPSSGQPPYHQGHQPGDRVPTEGGGLPTGLSEQGAWDAARSALGYTGPTAQSQATLQAIADYLAANGYGGYSATGPDTIQTPSGQSVDVLTSGNQWWWGPEGQGGGGGLLAPWTQPFSPPTFTEPFSYPGFQAPTELTEQNDPGFQARLQLGQQALERSASAKGTLLSGGTLKALEQYGQDFASNEYGNVYNRAFNDWSTGYSKALGEYGQRYGMFSDAYNRALNEYNLAQSTFYQNQDRPFNKLFNLSSLGANTASGLNNLYGSLYGGLFGNLFRPVNP